MGAFTHVHLSRDTSAMRVSARRDDEIGGGTVFLQVSSGDTTVTFSDDPDGIVALLERMRDAVTGVEAGTGV